MPAPTPPLTRPQRPRSTSLQREIARLQDYLPPGDQATSVPLPAKRPSKLRPKAPHATPVSPEAKASGSSGARGTAQDIAEELQTLHTPIRQSRSPMTRRELYADPSRRDLTTPPSRFRETDPSTFPRPADPDSREQLARQRAEVERTPRSSSATGAIPRRPRLPEVGEEEEAAYYEDSDADTSNSSTELAESASLPSSPSQKKGWLSGFW